MVKQPSSAAEVQTPVPRRERERAFRSRLILEASEEVFAASGFQGASIGDIAGRSEVAIATLYNLFGSKEAIFAALVDFRQNECFEAIRSATLAPVSPRARIERFVESIFHYFDGHQRAFHIYVGATQGFPWHIRSSLGERSFAKYQELLDLLTGLIVAAVRAEVRSIAVDEPARLAAAAMGILMGLLTQRHVGGDPLPLEEEIRSANAMIGRLLGLTGAADAQPTASRSGGRKR